MSYLEELLPEFRKGAKIRQKHWEDGQYIFVHANGSIYLATGRLFRFDTDRLLSDAWELYQESIDWEYVIKNKCLCYFWDGNSVSDIRLGYLTKLMSDFPNKKEFSYCKDNGGAFKYCRPVCKYEVTFYEDRKS